MEKKKQSKDDNDVKLWYDKYPWSSKATKDSLTPLLAWERRNELTGEIVRVGGIFGNSIKKYEASKNKRIRELWCNQYPWTFENDAVTPLKVSERRNVVSGEIIYVDEAKELDRGLTDAAKAEEGKPWYDKYPYTTEDWKTENIRPMTPMMPWQRRCLLSNKRITPIELWRKMEEKWEEEEKKKEEKEMTAMNAMVEENEEELRQWKEEERKNRKRQKAAERRKKKKQQELEVAFGWKRERDECTKQWELEDKRKREEKEEEEEEEEERKKSFLS